jgi:multidrug efflux pump subunit AcrB
VLALFIGACSLPALGILKTEFFPKSDQSMMALSVEAPAGTPIEVTSHLVTQIETQLQGENEVESLSTAIGQLSDLSSGESLSGDQYATVTLNLMKKENGREESSLDIADRLRNKFASFS